MRYTILLKDKTHTRIYALDLPQAQKVAEARFGDLVHDVFREGDAVVCRCDKVEQRPDQHDPDCPVYVAYA